ncbi:MAG: HPP family protein [Pseudomonadota bacterium]
MAITVYGPGISEPVPVTPGTGERPAPAAAIAPLRAVREDEGGGARPYAARRLRSEIDAADERQRSATRALLAGELMSESLLTLPGIMPLGEARRILHAHGVEHAPVVDADGRLVGLLEQAGLLAAAWPPEGPPLPDAASVLVSEACRKPVEAVRRDTPFEAMVRLMLDGGYAATPVVDGEGVVIGLVTRADLLRGAQGVVRLEAWA